MWPLLSQLLAGDRDEVRASRGFALLTRERRLAAEAPGPTQWGPASRRQDLPGAPSALVHCRDLGAPPWAVSETVTRASGVGFCRVFKAHLGREPRAGVPASPAPHLEGSLGGWGRRTIASLVAERAFRGPSRVTLTAGPVRAGPCPGLGRHDLEPSAPWEGRTLAATHRWGNQGLESCSPSAGLLAALQACAWGLSGCERLAVHSWPGHSQDASPGASEAQLGMTLRTCLQ